MRQIDADALKEELQNEYEIELENVPFMKNDKRISIDVINEIIDSAPTINEWIPTSKAMPPEHEEAYDVFNPETGEWDRVNKEIEMESDNVIVTVLNNDGTRDTWFDYTVNGDFGFDDPILAWMPMPEPYEG